MCICMSYLLSLKFCVQCCIDNAWDIATLLILKGAKVNHVDGQLWSPLHIACAYDSEDMVDLLLEVCMYVCICLGFVN